MINELNPSYFRENPLPVVPVNTTDTETLPETISGSTQEFANVNPLSQESIISGTQTLGKRAGALESDIAGYQAKGLEGIKNEETEQQRHLGALKEENTNYKEAEIPARDLEADKWSNEAKTTGALLMLAGALGSSQMRGGSIGAMRAMNNVLVGLKTGHDEMVEKNKQDYLEKVGQIQEHNKKLLAAHQKTIENENLTNEEKLAQIRLENKAYGVRETATTKTLNEVYKDIGSLHKLSLELQKAMLSANKLTARGRYQLSDSELEYAGNAILEGRRALSDVSFKNRDAVQAWVEKEHPGFNFAESDAKIKANAKSLAKLVSVSDIIQTFTEFTKSNMALLDDMNEKFKRGQYPAFNNMMNFIEANAGDPQVANFKDQVYRTALDFQKVQTAGAGISAAELSDGAQKKADEMLNSTLNFDQVKERLEMWRKDLMNKSRGINDTMLRRGELFRANKVAPENKSLPKTEAEAKDRGWKAIGKNKKNTNQTVYQDPDTGESHVF